jgi:hypothetical protein
MKIPEMNSEERRSVGQEEGRVVRIIKSLSILDVEYVLYVQYDLGREIFGTEI